MITFARAAYHKFNYTCGDVAFALLRDLGADLTGMTVGASLDLFMHSSSSLLMMHLDDVYNHEMWSDRMKCHQRLVAYLLYRAL